MTLARSEAPGITAGSDVSPRASASTAAAGVTPPAPAAAPLAPTTCATCHEPIGPTSVGVYGHTRNPGADHHYARPTRTQEDAMKQTSVTVSYKGRSATVTDGDFAAGGLIEEAVRDAIGPLGDYVASEEVAVVAGRLIATSPMFGRLLNHRIAYLLDRRPATTATKNGVHGLAEVKLTPKLWRDLARVDAAIVVRRSAWDALTDQQREALVHHELMHLDENDKGGLVIRDHDLEEFGATVRAYGQWLPDVEHFVMQLRLFESAAA